MPGRGKNEVHPTGQGQLALAGAQALRGEVDRDEGGGAGSIDCKRWAGEPERMGDAPRGHGRRGAGIGIGADRLGIGGVKLRQRIVGIGDADEDADLGPG